MADLGFFQLNDIVLAIPPESIQIETQSFNNIWQTLRTQSSIKSKSGFAQKNITVVAKFADDVLHPMMGNNHLNGFNQLLDLVSQFRATPFCYVDNAHLRNAILSGQDNVTMALALRNMEISKMDQSTNIISVVMHFAWFNYFPFAKNFSFKKDIFVADEQTDPANSNAWKLFYKAEQKRNKYIPIKELSSKFQITYPEFRFISKEKYETLKKDVQTYRLFSKKANKSKKRLAKTELIEIIQDRNEDVEAASLLLDNLFGTQTSMSAPNITTLIDNTLKSPDYSLIVDQGWQVVSLNDENNKLAPLKFRTKLPDKEPDESEVLPDTDLILLERKHVIDFEQAGIFVTGIHISFENVLAAIPMLGYAYPTFQHIGSIDGVVTLSYAVDSEEGVKTLSAFYNAIDEQSHKNRQIPQGHRNIKINNSLINMCGLHHFLTNGMTIETLPGSPGIFVGSLELISDSLTPNTTERINAELQFVTADDVRTKVAQIMTERLKTSDKLLEKIDMGGITVNEWSQKDSYKIEKLRFTLGEGIIKKVQTLSASELQGYKTAGGSSRYGEQFHDPNYGYKNEHEYFTYVNKNNTSQNAFKVQAFKSVCNIWSKLLAEFVSDLLPAIQEPALREQAMELLNLNDIQILGITRIVADLKPVFDYIATKPLHHIAITTNRELLNNVIDKWQEVSVTFIDNQIIGAGLLQLEEFAEAKKLADKQSEGYGGDAYPDFPLDEVVNIISSSDSPTDRLSYLNLKGLFSKSELGLKHLGPSVLLNPDFYFYNPQNDVLDKIIPYSVMETAISAVKSSRVAMAKAEKDWFTNVYEPNILANAKASRVLVDAGTTKNKEQSKIILETQAGQECANRTKASLSEHKVAPNQLMGSITSSLKQASLSENPPISLGAIDSNARDDLNTIMNYRPQTILSDKKGTNGCVHFFDTNVLDFHSENELRNPSGKQLGSSIPGASYSVDARYRGKTYPIDLIEIDDQGNKLKKDAAIKFLEMKDAAEIDGIQLKINSSYRDFDEQAELSTAYDIQLAQWREGKADKPTPVAKAGKSKHQIGTAIDIETHGGGEVFTWLLSNAKHFGFVNTVPKEPWHWEFFWEEVEEDLSQGPLSGFEPQNDSLLTKSIEQFEKELHGGQGYSMMRAYPTFKLYFIENDMGERKRYAYDDFFSYSAVKSIQVIKSRKIAADLCILELTNVSGVLSNRKFHSVLDPSSPKNGTQSQKEDKKNRNTEYENPIASLLLQPGVEIQLRLGYSNNPNELEKVFNGLITDVQFSDTTDLVQITCQSFAVELVQTIHGSVKTWGGSFSTGGKTYQILEELLAFPEVVHFGRWKPGEASTQTQRSLLTNRWKIVPSPQDDNIFAPQGSDALGIVDTIIEKIGGTNKFTFYNTTLWDVAQEMTLRHPSYIASVVPYEDKFGSRATFYFGLPDQLYFARDPTFKEDNVIAALKTVVENGITDDNKEIVAQIIKDPRQSLDETMLADYSYDAALSYRDHWFKQTWKQYALDQGYIKPFRSYHVLTSALHIVYNSINASGHNTFNTATVQYGEGSASADEDTGNLNFGGSETFTLKADAAIPDEEVRELFAQYPNCIGEEMAKNYALSLLFQSMKESYKGSLVSIGNPKIKPYDICYIFDEYNDMFGPIEVEQVVHKFSQETGFLTEITPDMIVHVNQHATLSTSDAMGLITEHGLKSIGMGPVLPALKVASNILNISFSPVSAMFFSSASNTSGKSKVQGVGNLVGTFIFKKLLTRTQLAHPFRFSPLVLQSRPMIGGLPNRKTGGTFTEAIGDWEYDMKHHGNDYLESLMNRFSPRNWLNKTEGSIEFLNE